MFDVRLYGSLSSIVWLSMCIHKCPIFLADHASTLQSHANKCHIHTLNSHISISWIGANFFSDAELPKCAIEMANETAAASVFVLLKFELASQTQTRPIICNMTVTTDCNLIYASAFNESTNERASVCMCTCMNEHDFFPFVSLHYCYWCSFLFSFMCCHRIRMSVMNTTGSTLHANCNTMHT